MQKNEADCHLAPYTKINSLCNPNIKIKTGKKIKTGLYNLNVRTKL